ncbi:hypothetical protein PEBR_00510 [Penicillium brasilianum]|uniref:Uncharacterized protein n=1 Tax=Penicillium brasilianum TaxID=104259 RepID=A0A1S9S133_PENBI|nr:hypothetical protein PEBR_00510 [Penicillium brasilianum]
MPPASSLVLLFSLVSYCNGADDYYFVGDLAQYTTNGVPTPTLSGDVLDVTAVGDPAETGIMLFMYPDLEDGVNYVMDSKCAELDSACYQAVMDVLEASDRVLTTRSLEERQVGMLEGAAVAVAGILFLMFYRLVSNHDSGAPGDSCGSHRR